MPFEGVDGDRDAIILFSGCGLCRKVSLTSLHTRLSERAQPKQVRPSVSPGVQQCHSAAVCSAFAEGDRYSPWSTSHSHRWFVITQLGSELGSELG